VQSLGDDSIVLHWLVNVVRVDLVQYGMAEDCEWWGCKIMKAGMGVRQTVDVSSFAAAWALG
jgi:hypothetical protein